MRDLALDAGNWSPPSAGVPMNYAEDNYGMYLFQQGFSANK